MSPTNCERPLPSCAASSRSPCLPRKTVDQYQDARIVNSLADIERLSQIVRALLLLSQAETGQLLLQKQRLDLVEVAEDIVDQFQIPAEGGEVTLQFISRIPRCVGDFDRVQIDRMLSNLLSNAIKFTPPGGVVRVILDRHEDRGRRFEVEDTGRGHFARTSASHLRPLLSRARDRASHHRRRRGRDSD